MVKEFLMKKLLISLGVFACVTVNAQTASDSVVMTVAGKQVPLSEFIFIAEKNGEVDLSSTKSVKSYVELFKNFKLKVAEAESLGIDQTSSFKSELDGYRAQLIDSYMSDKEGEKAYDLEQRTPYQSQRQAPCLSFFHRDASVCVRGSSPATE